MVLYELVNSSLVLRKKYYKLIDGMRPVLTGELDKV